MFALMCNKLNFYIFYRSIGYFMYLCPDMANSKQYVFNSETLSYEVKKRSKLLGIVKTLLLVGGSVCLAVFYMWLYTSVFGRELPKTVLLKKENARWHSKLDVMNARLKVYSNDLLSLEFRDNDIYRSIFGMNEISSDVRNAGFGGVNRYAHYHDIDSRGIMKGMAQRLDVLTKKSYVQSVSFDEISELSKRAGEMAACIPAIPPMNPDPEMYRVSSSFGYRSDPFSKKSQKHNGVDFAMKSGTPLYATGDGVVESVKFQHFGYGHHLVINHGFGYKTKYAHMSTITVVEGMTIKRGECIGLSGNTGKSSGPHLHYEVLYKGAHVNPANYYDLTVTQEEYALMVQETADASEKITLHPSHRR